MTSPTVRLLTLLLMFAVIATALLWLAVHVDSSRGVESRPGLWSSWSVLVTPLNLVLGEGRTRGSYYSADPYFPDAAILRNSAGALLREAELGAPRSYLPLVAGSRPQEGALEACPETMALLEPMLASSALISARYRVLSPGEELLPTYRRLRDRLLYQLCLEGGGRGAEVVMDSVHYTWEDQRDILFDPSFVHSWSNARDAPLLLLELELVRPCVGRTARALQSML